MICFTFSSTAAISFSCIRLKSKLGCSVVAGLHANIKHTERLGECKAKRGGRGNRERGALKRERKLCANKRSDLCHPRWSSGRRIRSGRYALGHEERGWRAVRRSAGVEAARDAETVPEVEIPGLGLAKIWRRFGGWKR